MIVKVDNYIDAYRAKAQYSQDVHELSGRRERRFTEFVNRRICSELELGWNDEVVDVGCGDGCLLRMAGQEKVASARGLTGTEEEAKRLRAAGLQVQRGVADSLPLPDATATVVVCNSVLHYVPAEKIAASLSELSRIARPGARVWIGEIPFAAEQESVPRHDSASAMLWFLLRKRGIRAFLGMGRRILLAQILNRAIILNSAPILAFRAQPEEFVALAEHAGLNLERYFRHEELDGTGRLAISPSRYDYVFRKAS